MSAKLYIGNLAYSITEDHLKKLFSCSGKVVSVKIVRDSFDQQSKGFGFVEMSTDQEAEKAISLLNEKVVCERGIRIASAHSNEAEFGPKNYKRPNKLGRSL